jgi:hypothetical protein
MSVVDDTPAESGWVYRRWWTFGSATAIYLLLVLAVVFTFMLQQPLLWVSLALIALLGVKDGLYLGGASVLDYAELGKGWMNKGGDNAGCKYKEAASE